MCNIKVHAHNETLEKLRNIIWELHHPILRLHDCEQFENKNNKWFRFLDDYMKEDKIEIYQSD